MEEAEGPSRTWRFPARSGLHDTAAHGSFRLDPISWTASGQRIGMDPAELLRAHVEALFTHDAEGCLLASNAPEGGSAPRVWIGRTAAGVMLRVRHDVDPATRHALEAAASRVPTNSDDVLAPLDPAPFAAALAEGAPVERVWSGPVYAFPPGLPPPDPRCVRLGPEDAAALPPALAPWEADVEASAPLVALVADGRALAVCASVRRAAVAHEAGVETAPEARGRGYAAPTVAAWARLVRAEGRVPLYSTAWENAASRAVARKLGLLQYGSELHLT